ncbi:hypothetical protein [Collimonas pratensis]|uniref:hypothetical protein n=1 Tax=Collimonas pratensis TaxID=279113 RepID=UPI000782C436|nr:hypothetical protein [Collimonas pratensis]
MTVTTTIDWGVQQVASLQRSIAGCGKPSLVRMEQLTGKSGRKILEAMMSGELPYPHRACWRRAYTLQLIIYWKYSAKMTSCTCH